MLPHFATALLLSMGTATAQDHAHHATYAPASATPPQSDLHVLHRAQAASKSSYRPHALTDAERAAAFPVLHVAHEHGDPLVWMVQADRSERTQANALAWEGQAWVGRDRGRLWLRSEGMHAQAATTASLEALWGKPVDAWWDVLTGVRHDFGDGWSRDWLALGVQGLAPYKFEVQATAYLGQSGRSMLQMEIEYELLLSNRLILQPRLEAVLHGRDDPMRRIGAGLSETSAGLRLRYEVRREFAPYIGYAWSRHHGRSADFVRAAGEDVKERGWVAGLRFWF